MDIDSYTITSIDYYIIHTTEKFTETLAQGVWLGQSFNKGQCRCKEFSQVHGYRCNCKNSSDTGTRASRRFTLSYFGPDPGRLQSSRGKCNFCLCTQDGANLPREMQLFSLYPGRPNVCNVFSTINSPSIGQRANQIPTSVIKLGTVE